jgi:hypothetical protein
MLGSKKVQKTVKTKYKKNQDEYFNPKEKKRHHDKSTYRLLRQERKEYVV